MVEKSLDIVPTDETSTRATDKHRQLDYDVSKRMIQFSPNQLEPPSTIRVQHVFFLRITSCAPPLVSNASWYFPRDYHHIGFS